MTPQVGATFPPGDADALVAAVERVLQDEPSRQAMGAAGRQLAQARYSWDAIARRLVGIYETITPSAAA
jgi:mannosyltransferase